MNHEELLSKTVADEFQQAKKEIGEEEYNEHYTKVFGKPVLNYARKIVFNLPQDCLCQCSNCIDYELRQSTNLNNTAYLQQALKVLQELPCMDSITITGGTLPSKDFNQLISYIKQYSPDASITWNTNGVNINKDYNVNDIEYINLHRQSTDDALNKSLLHTDGEVISLDDAKKLFKDKLTIRAVVNDDFKFGEYVSLGLPLFLNRQIPFNKNNDIMLMAIYNLIHIDKIRNHRRNDYVDGYYNDVPIRIGLGDSQVSHVPGRYPTFLNVVIVHRSGYVTGSWFEDDKVLLHPPQDIKEIMENEDEYLSSKGHLLMSCKSMMKYLTDNDLFLKELDFANKLLTFTFMIRDETLTPELERQFQRVIQRPFYKNIYQSVNTDEEFLSAITTLMLGREFAHELGQTDEEYEKELQQTQNTYLKKGLTIEPVHDYHHGEHFYRVPMPMEHIQRQNELLYDLYKKNNDAGE